MGEAFALAPTAAAAEDPPLTRALRGTRREEEPGKEQQPGKDGKGEDGKKKRVLKPRAPRPKLTLELLKVRAGLGGGGASRGPCVDLA